MCDTPVIGFDCTAIPEIVQTGKTGYLAKYKDSDNLAEGISLLYNHYIQPNWRDNYVSQDIVNMHLKLIEKYKK